MCTSRLLLASGALAVFFPTRGHSEELPYLRKPVRDVVLHKSDFWHSRLQTNRNVTIWHDLEQCETTGRLDNFRKAAGEMDGFYQGLRFDDSDVHKVLEGAARILGRVPNEKLEAHIDALITTMAKAQDEDGYLYTVMQVPHDPEGPPVKGVVPGERWLHERESHETYCMGHLIEAACIHFEETGKRNYLEIAIKAADLLDRTFGPGKLELPSGHQEVEIALARLAVVTGEKRYANLAHWFLEQRGRVSDDREGTWSPYFQDHVPVTEQTEAVGHAVRAAYQYAAMADIAVLKSHRPYRETLKAVWEDVAEKKLYLTGGIGGGSGEGFSGEYQLPNLGAYNETCSSIANILWQQRMFQLEGDAKYIEILERCLYNSFLSGVSLQGDSFFYPNKLTSPDGHTRSPWFRCACCPPNVVRIIPQIPSLSYATSRNTLFVNLYGSNTATTELNSTKVKVTQRSAYPWNGTIELTLQTDTPTYFTIALRIPGWLNKPFPSDLYHYDDDLIVIPLIEVNGRAIPFEKIKGYARLTRRWKTGDNIKLTLPMPVRQVVAHDNVDSCRGRAALMRGPLVYAAEGPDNDGHVHNLVLSEKPDFKTRRRPKLLRGLTILHGAVERLSWTADGTGTTSAPHLLSAIPYYAWAHRGKHPMRVWLATQPESAWPAPSQAAYTTATVTSSGNNRWTSPGYLNDQFLPQSSTDRETPRYLWDNTPGAPVGAGELETTGQADDGLDDGIRWVQYEFAQPVTLGQSQLYWCRSEPDHHGRDRLPTSFRLLYLTDGKWQPVTGSFPSPKPDTLQEITFPEISTTSIRLEATPRPGHTAGLFEWIVR